MNVLWICSFAPRIIAEEAGLEVNRFGGWIDGTMEALLKQPDIRLGIAFPQYKNSEIIEGIVSGISYFGFPLHSNGFTADDNTRNNAKYIRKQFKPDVIHYWGAEFPFAYDIMLGMEFDEHSICSIQGLCGIYSKHFFAAIPDTLCKKPTIRDFLRKDSIFEQRKKYINRGVSENKILTKVANIIGRTEWDNACASQISPKANYYHCNEILRSSFYINKGKWNSNACEPFSIFASQANYPIKGFHMLLQALPEVLKKYPQTVVYTTGIDPRKIPFYKRGRYQNYLIELIKENNLDSKIIFLGALDENKMCEQYLKTRVFVSPSSIENSPNSVGEAMLLGMPIVASYVGGTMNLLSDKEDGFLYQFDAPYMLAKYICKFFESDELSKQLGESACRHASITHSRTVNAKVLHDIYVAIK